MLYYKTDYQARNFLTKYSNSLLPKITIAARLTTCTKALTDNIFDSNTDENITGGKLTSSISNQLAQLFVYTNKITQNEIK